MGVKTRIYVVMDEAGTERLVEAVSGSGAIKHCVVGKYSARVAKSSDVAALMGGGVKLEFAGADEEPIGGE